MKKRLRIFLVIFSVALFGSPLTAQEEVHTHVIQPGENLYRIALRYGVSVTELAQANSITNQSRILAGQSLIIPGLSAPDEDADIYNPLIAGMPIIYIVQQGDILSTIAQQYDVTVDQILQANNLGNPDQIFSGQELRIWSPGAVDSVVNDALKAASSAAEEANLSSVMIEEVVMPEDAETATSYTVQSGEHLSQIAERFGVSWIMLAEMNAIADPNRLYAGQVLSIPIMNTEGGVIDMGILTPYYDGVPQPTITVGRQIVVDLSEQRVYAYEDGMLQRTAVVSTGLPATPTIQGEFTIWHRTESQTMSGPGYYLPNVQWVQYFYQGYGFHGTYWHNNFGQPMSHGCVNMTNEDAEWLYNFGSIGTAVLVQA